MVDRFAKLAGNSAWLVVGGAIVNVDMPMSVNVALGCTSLRSSSHVHLRDVSKAAIREQRKLCSHIHVLTFLGGLDGWGLLHALRLAPPGPAPDECIQISKLILNDNNYTNNYYYYCCYDNANNNNNNNNNL